MIKTTKFYILVSVWMTWPSFKVRVVCLFYVYSVRCHNLLVCWRSCKIFAKQVILKGDNSADVIWLDTHLTSPCVWTLVNWFVSNLVWYKTRLNCTVCDSHLSPSYPPRCTGLLVLAQWGIFPCFSQPRKRKLLCMCRHRPPAAYTDGSCVRLLFLYEAGIAVCRRS